MLLNLSNISLPNNSLSNSLTFDEETTTQPVPPGFKEIPVVKASFVKIVGVSPVKKPF